MIYLNSRWTELKYHPEQQRLWNSTKRFCVIPSGRRSGKTELAKRKLVTKALRGTRFPRANFFAAAPTRDQAKRIFWEDLKALIPRGLIRGKPKESDLTIELVNGSMACVLGLDVPERIEGSPWDWGVLDEYGNMKEKVWNENVRPALSDRLGGAWLIGVPEGRNHYYRIFEDAKNDTTGEWDAFHWLSADILPPEEIQSAKEKLDELTFQQEYEGSFLNFQGRIYYKFDRSIHCRRLIYLPDNPIHLCFDFNVSPGVCAVIQEQESAYTVNGVVRSNMVSGAIAEVYIPRDSNTERVCKQFLDDFHNHKGDVICYGDSTGGSSGSAKVKGSDWDIVSDILRPVFGTRLSFDVSKKNPPERSRINSFNSRLMSSTGIVRFMVDSLMCRHLMDDLEGVQAKEGSGGEIDKKSNPELTHLSDAVGYYIHRKYPVSTIETGMHKRRVSGV